jgi:3-dehydroquinate synthase
MIEIDEFDSGPRNVFNYGHSFGHALETTTSYNIPHGVAVCYGMDLANCISVKLGYASKAFRNNVRESLIHVWEKSNLHLDELATFFLSLGRDKKNEGNNIKVILTRGFGNMFKTTLEINDDMKQFIADYFNNKQWKNNI